MPTLYSFLWTIFRVVSHESLRQATNLRQRSTELEATRLFGVQRLPDGGKVYAHHLRLRFKNIERRQKATFFVAFCPTTSHIE
ncbi:hypothetical protein G6M04_28750 [Agrobacterium rhizogenes]|uniref:hypothetical protein n=1 Tax=Rhizobium rhizogenes TaxID=359 RepID=UPI001572B16F|nr:hypothetical protein [Rhizobium rhizogenes]NTG51396.1 hypothetical protein [Rhizobium rhizogenes]